MACFEWKSIVGFLMHLLGLGYSIIQIVIAFAKPGSECDHIPDSHLHIYLYGSAMVGILTSLIHIIVMYRCIGRSEDEIAGTEEEEKVKGNKQYIYLTLGCLLPNVIILVFGLIILLSAKDPPPTHELEGIGIKGENYCYWGLWATLHLSLCVSGILIGLALMISMIVACQIKNQKTTVWSQSTLPRKRRETSWNGSAQYNAPNRRNQPIVFNSENPNQERSKKTKNDKFVRTVDVRNSNRDKWNTPKRKDMKKYKKSDYDPYRARDS